MNRFDPRIYLFTLGHFSVDWAQGAIPALLPYFISACQLSYQDAGTLAFANILLSSVAQPVFGYYADKVSKPWFAPLGIIITGISLSAMAFTTSFTLLFILSMMAGLGSAIYHPEAAHMINDIAGENKGKAMGTFSLGGNGGFAVGPMFAGFCAYMTDVRLLALFGVFNAIVAIILHHFLPGILSDIAGMKRKAAAAGVENTRNDWKSFGKLTVLIFARSIGFTVCNTFLPIFWIQVLHADASEGSFILTILFSLGCVITYFGGLLADRIGCVRMLRIAFISMIPAMFLLINNTNTFFAMILLLPAAFALFAPFSASVVLGQNYLGKNVAFASGITLGLSTTFGGLVTPVIGRAADTFGLVPALQILWVVAILGAIFSFTLKSDRKETKEITRPAAKKLIGENGI